MDSPEPVGPGTDRDPDHPGATAVVVCAGLLTLDVVQVVERLPRSDEKIVGRDQQLVVGGPAANAAAVAAALGARARLLAPFGRSPITPWVAGALAAAAVEWIDPMPGLDHPAPVSTVLVTAETGTRAVVSGGAPPLPPGWAPGPGLIDAALEGAAVLLLDGHAAPLGLGLARAARRRGIPVVFDGGSHRCDTADLLAHVDLAILSADFLAPDADDPLDWVLGHGPAFAVQSAGAGPVRVRVGAGAAGRGAAAYQLPVPRVPVRDTLGAGDVLHGAAAVALARLGLRRAAVRRALGYAVRLAALSCRHPGALGWAADPGSRAAAHRLSTALVHRAVEEMGHDFGKASPAAHDG